ncbi:hypothetical protein V8E52_003033 [Russula decolorans]
MFIAMQCISIFNAIVRMFSRAKRPKKDVVPEEGTRPVPSVLHKFRERRERAADDPFTLIEMLPDEILLEIFDFHRLATLDDSSDLWEWHRLVHVCRRWRNLIFQSPRRLDLRLAYTYKNPPRKSLELWPDLPVSVWYPKSPQRRRLSADDEENVLAVLKHANRICDINLSMTRQLASNSAASLKESFPILQRLQLRSQEPIRPLPIPDGFLGESTPLLRDIHLIRTVFPALPVLLLSAQALLTLQLDDIPNSGYFSPEALAKSLSGMAKLNTLKIRFLPPNAHERSLDASLTNRAILPALTEFEFKGNCEYVEDLVSRIDAPALGKINITFIEQPTFGIPRLARFIGRTKEAKLPHHTSVRLSDEITITQHFRRPSCADSSSGTFLLQIPCDELDRQVSLLIHVCQYISEPLLGVERFDIESYPRYSNRMDGEEMDTSVWLELFRSFRGAKSLEVSGGLVTSVASALGRATGEMARIVLPALRDLRMLDSSSTVSASTSIEQFIAARQLYNRPVAVHYEKEGSLDDKRSEHD